MNLFCCFLLVEVRPLPFVDVLLHAELIELQLQASQVLGILLLSYYIMQFVGVFLDVVELIAGSFLSVEVQELVSAVAHAIVAADVVFGGAVVVVVVEVVLVLVVVVVGGGGEGEGE